MDLHRIKELLEKFYKGLTSLAEEQELHEFFVNSAIVPSELKGEQAYFKMVHTIREGEKENPVLEEKLSGLIDAEENRSSRLVRIKRIYRYAIAACITLLIGISVVFIYDRSHHSIKDTYTNPQLAYQEAQKTLLYISQRMNTGIEPLGNIKKINAGMEKLKPLGKLDKGLDNLRMVSLINNASNQKR
jgi:hypothetical protein